MKLSRVLLLLAGASCAFFSPARAQIVYSGPQNIAITAATFPAAAPFKIDFNNDGIFDLDLFFNGPLPQIIMVGALPGGAYAGADSIVTDYILPGQSIDGSRLWWTLAGDLNATIGPSSFAPFSGKRGFIGARFTVGPDNYYGWIDYAGNATAPTTGTVFGWAYESTPNRAIAAGAIPGAVPEPGTYGLVAAGVMIGLCLFQRRTAKRIG